MWLRETSKYCNPRCACAPRVNYHVHGVLQTFVDYRYQSLRGHCIYGPTMTMNISSTVCEYELYLYVVPLALLAICNCWAWQSVKSDKGLAENDEWRISQTYLLRQAWLGGVGGWLSMKYYHHKTSVTSKKATIFREKYEYRMKRNLITCLFLLIFVFLRPLQMFFC